MATGELAAARSCIHPEYVNHMAADEPPACALPGLPGFAATSAWLRSAFSDLRFEPIELVSDEARTMAHVVMSGVQTGPFVIFPPGRKPVAFPPTERAFSVRQCHVFRIADGLHAEHIAVRDDLGMMTQLGHLPPSPRAVRRLAAFKLTGAFGGTIADARRVAEEAARLEAATGQ